MDDEVCTEGEYPKIEYGGKVAGQAALHDRPISVSGKDQVILDNAFLLMFVIHDHLY